MDHGLTRVARIVLAALVAVAVYLLVLATPVVAAGYPVLMHRRVHVTPLSTTELVIVVLVAVAFAIGALLYVWSRRRGSVAEVKRLAVRHEREQKHEQTPKAA
jgi:hypothetical protein